MNKIQIGMPISFVTLAGLLVWYSITMTVHTASGQMMVGPNMMNNNMSWTMESDMASMMKGENITGSINLMSTISKAIASEVKVGLSEAVEIAEKSVGNASHAMAANIGGDSGYLVYNVFVVDSNGKMHKIIIDPADRKILLSRELPRFESMMMMHQGMMMRGQRMMGNGMMGNGMMGNGNGWQ